MMKSYCMMLLSSLFQPSKRIDFNYKTPEEIAHQIKHSNLRRQATFTVDSTEEEIQFWLYAWELTMLQEGLRGYDGRKLLLMSKKEEQELEDRLQRPVNFEFIARIRDRRERLGIADVHRDGDDKEEITYNNAISIHRPAAAEQEVQGNAEATEADSLISHNSLPRVGLRELKRNV